MGVFFSKYDSRITVSNGSDIPVNVAIYLTTWNDKRGIVEKVDLIEKSGFLLNPQESKDITLPPDEPCMVLASGNNASLKSTLSEQELEDTSLAYHFFNDPGLVMNLMYVYSRTSENGYCLNSLQCV